MYIIETKEKNRWKFRSSHKNLDSAECNFQAVNNKSIRIRKGQTIIASKKKIIH